MAVPMMTSSTAARNISWLERLPMKRNIGRITSRPTTMMTAMAAAASAKA